MGKSVLLHSYFRKIAEVLQGPGLKAPSRGGHFQGVKTPCSFRIRETKQAEEKAWVQAEVPESIPRRLKPTLT